ncbi:MAG: helix-turn-helix domain-containing protein [Clostridiales bacterium]|nr:helix-turn-helix domain-containing protein [Clostridiales bacterium]
MRSTAFFSESNYQVLSGLEETSNELMLVQVGLEDCRPFHIISDPRTEYIIHFVLRGAGFYSVNGSTWPVRAGQMFLIRPGESIVYGSERNDPWSYAWMGFRGVRAETMVRLCGFSKGRLVLPLEETDDVLSCIREIMDHKSAADSDVLLRESCMVRVFALLARANERLNGMSRPASAVSSDAMYAQLGQNCIREMYMRADTGVEDIAAQVGVSRARLNRAFRNELNMSVQQCLIECRLRQAAALLVNTALPVKEIAGLTGYNDQLVFSKAFKKRYGAGPKAYREGAQAAEGCAKALP